MKKATERKGDFFAGMPEGFDTVQTRREITGYVQWAEGVIVQGIVREIFQWTDAKNKDRETIIVSITEPHGLTLTEQEERGEFEAAIGNNAGLDMKYGLKCLADHIGKEVYITCLGKTDIGDGKSVYNFDIGVKRAARK